MKIFKKILIANRGEIAVRIIRSAHEMGIETVAVYSDADAQALHVQMATEAYLIGSRELNDSYLNIDKIMDVARRSGADAIHPGYGFLSENPLLVQACEEAGITFIGPSVQAITMMGNKIKARRYVSSLGIPMTRGATGDVESIIKETGDIPLPLLVKAAAGGGGKGMRIITDRAQLKETIEATSREAKAYFGDGQVYVEQYIEEPRHIEIQVIGDKHGHAVHLYERECSIQRRYQKIIEESPSPTLNDEVREKMGKAAVEIAKGIGYDSAGTIEFLVDKNLRFYFLEMNTRIQVEHPVTEMVTDIDIVKEQIMVAAGNPLSLQQQRIKQQGHAIECRIYAENPAENFRPSPGEMTFYHQPSGIDIRVDSGIDQAGTIHSFYDPMIAKLISKGSSREQAMEKMLWALKDYVIHGIDTNIEYLIGLMETPSYKQNKISTKYCDLHSKSIIQNIEKQYNKLNKQEFICAFLVHDFLTRKHKQEEKNLWNNIGYWRFNPVINLMLGEEEITVRLVEHRGNRYKLMVGNELMTADIKKHSLHSLRAQINGHCSSFFFSADKEGSHFVSRQGFTLHIRRMDEYVAGDVYVASDDHKGGDKISSPMPGKIIKVMVSPGQQVHKGDTLVIVEAMKMENNIEAHRDAIVEEVNVAAGDSVDSSMVMIKLKEEEQE